MFVENKYHITLNARELKCLSDLVSEKAKQTNAPGWLIGLKQKISFSQQLAEITEDRKQKHDICQEPKSGLPF